MYIKLIKVKDLFLASLSTKFELQRKKAMLMIERSQISYFKALTTLLFIWLVGTKNIQYESIFTGESGLNETKNQNRLFVCSGNNCSNVHVLVSLLHVL